MERDSGRHPVHLDPQLTQVLIRNVGPPRRHLYTIIEIDNGGTWYVVVCKD